MFYPACKGLDEKSGSQRDESDMHSWNKPEFTDLVVYAKVMPILNIQNQRAMG